VRLPRPEALASTIHLTSSHAAAGDAAGAGGDGGVTCEVASSAFIPLLEGAVAEFIAKWQDRPAPRGTAAQVHWGGLGEGLAGSGRQEGAEGWEPSLIAVPTDHSCTVCRPAANTHRHTDSLRP
jgi:hypothetical protein